MLGSCTVQWVFSVVSDSCVLQLDIWGTGSLMTVGIQQRKHREDWVRTKESTEMDKAEAHYRRDLTSCSEAGETSVLQARQTNALATIFEAHRGTELS